MTIDEKVKARFWAKVKKGEGCWLWQAAARFNGAGFFRMSGKNRIAHRVAWDFCCGPIPPGKVVCHRCDTPACVNPDHLFLGTQADNLRDMCAKGRQARGETCSGSRLKNAEILAIRQRIREGAKIKPLARELKIHPETIRRIRDRKSWKHLP